MNESQPAADWTQYQRIEISNAIRHCRNLMNAGLLDGVYSPEMQEAGLTSLLINLNDLLQKLSSVGHRFAATNDIDPASRAKDVTDLINNARNAACHLGSPHHRWEAGKFSFTLLRGYAPGAVRIGGVVMGGLEYADDTAVVFGANRVYWKRHVVPAFEAVCRHFHDALGAFGR